LIDEQDQRDETHDKLLADCRADYIRRDREFAKFLWYGSPNAPLIQRITAGFISVPPLALGLLLVGGVFKAAAYGDKILAGLVGTPSLSVGARILGHAIFRHPRRPD
jgi:hypothetical protein